MPNSRFLKAYVTALRILSSYGLFFLLKKVRGEVWAERHVDGWHRKNARRLVRTILELKGLFIKVGQLVSILTNFLPEAFRQELEELQDRVPPGDFSGIAGRIRTELGADPEKVFEDFDRSAIASASLAQVHRAKLSDGRDVAVKVQHADIEEIARRDLKTLRSILRLVERLLGLRGLEEQYQQLEEMIAEELDFEQEGRNMEMIAANFSDDPQISFPSWIAGYSSRRILTTEFVEGVKISDIAALNALGINRSELAERIVGAYCKMIFVDGLYHADPHPGNILVQPDGTIVFLDFGAVAHLSPEMKAGIPEFLLALLRRDAGKLREALKRMGFIARGQDESRAVETLEEFHEKLFERLNFESFTLGEVNPESAIEMKMETIADFQSIDVSLRELTSAFRVPKDWLMLERTVLLLVGLCTHLDPGMNPLKTVRPYLNRYVLDNEGGWRGKVRSTLSEMALAAVALPEELHKFLAKANKGRLVTRVEGLRESAGLIYALGHQFLYAFFTVVASAFAYSSHIRGEENLRSWGIGIAAFFALALLVSMVRARSLKKRA
ncbi:MAG: AarF/ABC1/UbiB kinase family protein [Ignavibacteriae bacterium]|nr:AarF/ABC1/UbiB kinase family protein [Ignavibacteriota bacterium]MCB9215110.1 AarF/ABC1/UbiB kinase family protein [Ignavibacteria bacterium]